jgi:excisionase family DNA binding protein
MTEEPIQLAYTISDVEKRARIGRTLIYREIAEGRLRAVKAGRRTLILDPDLLTWLEALPAFRSAADTGEAPARPPGIINAESDNPATWGDPRRSALEAVRHTPAPLRRRACEQEIA